MTPFGQTVARELRFALVPIETASIVDYVHLSKTMRALMRNALFFTIPQSKIDKARDHAQDQADALAWAIHEVGVQPQGISLAVDQARADAIVAMQELIDAVADAEPTVAAKALGIG